MIQEETLLENRYNQFVEKVVQNKVVYTLAIKEGIAVCPSNMYDAHDGKPAVVLTYWSEEKIAQSCQREEWEQYDIMQIPLSEFIEAWCLGMAEDGVIAGIDFDTQLFGCEILPIDLLTDLLSKIEQQKVSITFKNFRSVQEIRDYIEEVQNLSE